MNEILPSLDPTEHKVVERAPDRRPDPLSALSLPPPSADKTSAVAAKLPAASAETGEASGDRLARGRAAARSLGVPEVIADLDPDEMVALARTSARYRLLSANPQLNAWLQEGNNQELAGDDLEPLSELEQLGGTAAQAGLAPGGFWQGLTRSFVAGGVNAAGMGLQGLGRLAAPASRGLEEIQTHPGFELEPQGALGPFFGPGYSSEEEVDLFRSTLDVLGPVLIDAGEATEDLAEWIDVPPEERTFAHDVAGGLGQFAGQLVLFMSGPAGQVTLTGLLFGQGVEIQRRQQIEAGVDPNDPDAHMAQFVGGVVSLLLDRFSLKALTKRLPSLEAYLGRHVAGAVKGGVVEGTQEMTEAVLQRVITSAVAEGDIDLLTGLWRDGLVGGNAGALLGLLREAMTPGKGRGAQFAPSPRPEEEGAIIAAINATTQKSKLAVRSPSAFQDLVGRIVHGRGYRDLYVSAEAFVTYLRDKGELPGEVARRLGLPPGRVIQVAKAGGRIAIPTEAYAAQLAGTHGAWFVDNASFSPWSQRPQGESASAKAIREREEALLQAETAELAELEQEVTRQFLDAGLPEEAARQTVQPLVAFYRTLGERTGRSAREAFLAVGGVQVRGGQIEQLSETVDDLPPLVLRQETSGDGEPSSFIGPGDSQEKLEAAYRDYLDDPTAVPTTRDFVDGEEFDLLDLPRFFKEHMLGRKFGTRTPNVRFRIAHLNNENARRAAEFDPVFDHVPLKVTISNRVLSHVQGRRGSDLAILLEALPHIVAERSEVIRSHHKNRVILARRVRLIDGSESGKSTNQTVTLEAVPVNDGIEIVSMQFANDKGLRGRRRQATRNAGSAGGGGGRVPSHHIGAGAPHAETASGFPPASGNIKPNKDGVKADDLPEVDLTQSKVQVSKSLSESLEKRTAGVLRGFTVFPTMGGRTDAPVTIFLTDAHDLSTALHEMGHVFLEFQLTTLRQNPHTAGLLDDVQFVKEWWNANADALAAEAGVSRADVETLLDEDLSPRSEANQRAWRAMHEQWARAFEAYLREGKAPSEGLKQSFRHFKDWLLAIYRRQEDLGVTLSPEIRGVFDRMLATREEVERGMHNSGYRAAGNPRLERDLQNLRADAEEDLLAARLAGDEEEADAALAALHGAAALAYLEQEIEELSPAGEASRGSASARAARVAGQVAKGWTAREMDEAIYQSAQAEAGRSAAAALAAGDRLEALRQRQRQLINHHLWIEARKKREQLRLVQDAILAGREANAKALPNGAPNASASPAATP